MQQLIHDLVKTNEQQLEKIKLLQTMIEAHDLKQSEKMKHLRVKEVDQSQKFCYWNTNQDIHIFNSTLDLVYKTIDIASTYGGVVFGGFVRNVAAPLKLGTMVSGYKDVDFWFKSEEQADKFVQFMLFNKLLREKKQNHTTFEEPLHEKKEAIYNFKRTQYFLIGNKGETVIIIDVVISKILPVDDLNVNQLVFDGTRFLSMSEETSTIGLLQNIKDKKALVLPTCVNSKEPVNIRRLTNLCNSGWTLYDGNAMKFIPK